MPGSDDLRILVRLPLSVHECTLDRLTRRVTQAHDVVPLDCENQPTREIPLAVAPHLAVDRRLHTAIAEAADVLEACPYDRRLRHGDVEEQILGVLLIDFDASR